MYKGIKWLKEEVGELNLVDTVFEADGVSYIDTAVSVMQVYDLIDRLDEQEVLSHKWISDHIIFNEKEDAEYIYADELQNLIVPKQELPVVPKHVGEWITRYREKYDLYPALRMLENNTFVWGEIYEWYRMNTRKFVNAYLTGEYEAEEETLYYALIKGHELVDGGKVYWIHDKNNDDMFISLLHSSYDSFLTEMSESEWNELGINDSNADFVRVDEELN